MDYQTDGQLQKLQIFTDLAKQIPNADVRTTRGGDVLIIVNGPHPDGKHSILWTNYPTNDPAVYHVFSHYNDFTPEARQSQRVRTIVSTAGLLLTLDQMYNPPELVQLDPVNLATALKTTTGAEWVELISQITHADIPDTTPLDIAADLMADLLDYAEAQGLDIQEIMKLART